MHQSPSTIFITGATSGFGEALARRAVREGAHVILTGRREDRLTALRAELGEAAHAVALDVCDRALVDACVAALPPAFAQVDALINNAGLALGLAPTEAIAPEAIDRMIDTNIKGVLHCTKALLPGMIARNHGHIVNIGSIAGTYPYPGGNVYGATKAFLAQFSLNLRADLLGKNIRVTNIEPGMCDTEFSLTRFGGDKAKADAVYAGMQPLTAEDIAETIWWALTRPPHVNVNRMEIMPVMQAFSPFSVARED